MHEMHDLFSQFIQQLCDLITIILNRHHLYHHILLGEKLIHQVIDNILITKLITFSQNKIVIYLVIYIYILFWIKLNNSHLFIFFCLFFLR